MLRRYVHSGWRPLALLLVALAVAGGAWLAATELWPRLLCLDPAQFPARLVVRPRTVADLLAHPPAPGESVEVDAYYSGAGIAAPDGSGPGAGGQAILSDQPFLAELSLLGGALANALPGDAPRLVAALPPGAAGPQALPYRARFRGRLSAPPAEDPGAPRVFTIEQVVRIYAQHPPAQRAAADPAAWPRYRSAEGGYGVVQPPGWYAEPAKGGGLVLRAPQWPDSPVSIRVHPGETHDDPYDPAAAPPLLVGQAWRPFRQGEAAGQGLTGYRIDREEGPGERVTSVLLSAHGKTYELSVRYPLGFAAPQPVLSAYSAIVAAFRFDEPPGPTPTPPVRQALGAGPFLDEEEALEAACGRLEGEIKSLEARLLPEVEARRLASEPTAFAGHYDGVWVLDVNTPRAVKTNSMRLFFDALTGRELVGGEIGPEAAPLPTATPLAAGAEPIAFRQRELSGRAARRIEVILAQQTLIAWEGDVPVRKMRVSTGKAHTPTVTGTFRIYFKIRSTTMQGPGYRLPDVPHTMLFQHEGYAIHGTYWHSNFGTPMSRGCVNLSLSDAAWLFDWADPELPPGAWSVEATPCNPGALVVVH